MDRASVIEAMALAYFEADPPMVQLPEDITGQWVPAPWDRLVEFDMLEFRETALSAARSSLAAIEAAGWAVVSVEETAKALRTEIGEFTEWAFVPHSKEVERWLRDRAMLAADAK